MIMCTNIYSVCEFNTGAARQEGFDCLPQAYQFEKSTEFNTLTWLSKVARNKKTLIYFFLVLYIISLLLPPYDLDDYNSLPTFVFLASYNRMSFKSRIYFQLPPNS